MSEIPIMDNSLCIRFDCFNFFQVWKRKKHLARFLLFYVSRHNIVVQFLEICLGYDARLIFLQEQMQIS